MKSIYLTSTILLIFTSLVFSQNSKSDSTQNPVPDYKFSVSTTYLTFMNFGGPEETNTHHVEFHFDYKFTPKDRIGIKVASWELFAPMGIQVWDSLFLNESEFFPGKLKERGTGISYQRMLWKGLFATVEVLPLIKTYYDADKLEIGHGFKLYTTYHLGYHISLFKNRAFIEPQIHCNWWPIDTNAPQSFAVKENKHVNYFLFEPNLYLGININSKKK